MFNAEQINLCTGQIYALYELKPYNKNTILALFLITKKYSFIDGRVSV